MNFKYWLYNEVDWESDVLSGGFSDVSKTCISPEKLVELLNQQIDRLNSAEREKFFRSAERGNPKKMLLPQFTRGVLMDPLDPSKGREKYERMTMMKLEDFAKALTNEPKTVFDEGEKSKHSNELDPNSYTVNTGIPALRAVVYDKEAGKFYSINTCTGAGDCVVTCFALKNLYVLNDGKNLKLHQRINLMVNDPQRYYEKALTELRAIATKVIPPSREFPEGKTLHLRWNDAGDWFSEIYFNIARKVTEELKNMEIGGISFAGGGDSKKISFRDKIHSYAYTKQHKFVELGRQHDMTMNFSMGAKESEREKVNLNTTKVSAIIPREVFNGFFLPKKKDKPFEFKPGRDREQLRKAVHNYVLLNYLGLNNKSQNSLKNLLYPDELVKIPKSNEFKYNVIVISGDSDISAQRRDVHWTFLLEH